MERYKDRAFQRNYGFWNEAEQKALLTKKVAIAGVGGDGFQLGLKLAMMGVENFSIADPEDFEAENSNRVLGATTNDCGQNKADIFKKRVLELRPNAKIEIFNDGVTKDNVVDFMADADLVLDESELTHLEIGTNIAREARRIKVPDLFLMNIGFAAIGSSFHFEDNKSSFESIMGIPKGMPLDEIAEMKVDFSRCLPYVPNYGDISSLIAVEQGASLPSISPGVDIASAMGSTEVFLHLTNGLGNHRRQPTWAPKFRYMDSYNGESGVTSMPRASFYRRIMGVAILSKLGLNPRASYSQEERDSRNK